MKWRCLLPAFLISVLSFAQDGVSRVDQLIASSKKIQWTNPSQALDYADQALSLAGSISYSEGIARAENQKGFCFWSFGDNDLAIQSALHALEITSREHHPAIHAESHYILARGYMDMTDKVKAHAAILTSEHLANKTQDWELLCSIYNLKGVILFIEDKTDSALTVYEQAYAIGKKHHVDAINFPRIISNIGECYARKDPASGSTYFFEALNLAKQTQNVIAEASISDIIGHAYLKSKDIRNAEIYLTSALNLAQSLGLRRVVRHAYAGLVDIRVQQGRAEEAVVYLKKYYAVRDSLINASKVRQIVELEAKYALQLKEQDIRILEKENHIAALWMNFLIILVILILLISAGLYRLQQYRYRKNQDLLNVEIDYLTRRHRETEDKYKAALIQETEEHHESHDQKLLRSAIACVEQNISDPLFGVEALADKMNMSRTNLHRKLKSIIGLPPSELIRTIRLRKAASMILGKVNSISQIALQVGFDDYAHFSKSFKKHYGVAPTSYEDHVRNQQQPEQESRF